MCPLKHFDLNVPLSSISSHSILKMLLDPDLGLFKGIEGVLSVQTLALVARVVLSQL